MQGLPELNQATGLLPPGRYTANLDQLHTRFVAAPDFADSRTRKQLWAEWEQHRLIVEAVTGGISRLWLGGSFVSGKLDPGDIDVTYLLRAQTYDRLDRESLVALDELTDRVWCVEHDMRLDAYLIRLPEDVPFWQLMPSLFTPLTNDSFRDIGLYDEVWQCARNPSPSDDETGRLRRGYVEVLL
ncbi:hypothetical protein G3I19_35120 [Streptomyces sp. SID10853]|uniref:DUF6932 family protein n=1 Tax=Streptomyces sp. SID10853 TaxID=2706028 RepID=UPI0013C0ADB1|nr:hypothetical protein [Streptomyces sp. SID10853]NDZ83654.1 hypothetical protein [Streptomyces sp. SID10853]